jgi:predicted esterase
MPPPFLLRPDPAPVFVMIQRLSKFCPSLALALVAAVEFGVASECHYQRWDQHAGAPDRSSERVGEGLVIRGNGLGYYAWLRSLLIDHDWNFENEFDEHAVSDDYVPPPIYCTEVGRRANQWSVGPACVWASTIIPSHLLLKAWGGQWEANGYSLPYQFLVGATSLFLTWAGLLFLYGICLRFARPGRAALAAAILTLGSTIIYYGAVEVSMAHGLGTTALAALVWYWQRSYGSIQPGRWFTVGVLVGIAALMRWQLATFAVLPAGEALLEVRRGGGVNRKIVAGLALAAIGSLVAFLPQMIAWHCVYGHWLTVPVRPVTRHWLHPSLWDILLSQDRSLFYWTPITFIACVGAVALALRHLRGPAMVLLAAFIVQVYVLASLWGRGEYLPETGNYAGVFLSRSYGMRHLTESLVVLAPGLAWLLERLSGWRFHLLTAVGIGLSFLNLLLILQYSYGFLPRDAGLGLQALVDQSWQFLQEEFGTCLLLAEVLGLLWLLLPWGRQTPILNSPGGEEETHLQEPPSSPGLRLRLRVKRVFGLIGLALLGGFLGYPPLPEKHAGFILRVHRDGDGCASRYTLFVPAGYKGDQLYPLLVYLHGFGARGIDGGKPIADGPGPFIQERQKTFDMLALFPQSETGFWEADTADGRRVMDVLDDVTQDYAVDRQRIYLTGTSRGGFGVWSLAARYPQKWAAIVPICGGGDPASASAIRHVPCWCFHGAGDNVIDVGESRRMIEALKTAGANPRYTEYPDAGHGCWVRAYATPELWDWLRHQRLGDRPHDESTTPSSEN